MKVLVIGGSGRVGTLVNPYLRLSHRLRVYDLKPPADPSLDYRPGDVCDFDRLRVAAQGMDALLYMAMNTMAGGKTASEQTAFDVNVKGVHLALRAAHEAGIPHAVHCSTMSVYDGALEARYFPDEDMTPDGRSTYGFTKRLGEDVCRNAWHHWGISVNALRLCHPRSREDWLAQARSDRPSIPTDALDVGRLILAALEYRGGFQVFHTSGDYQNKIMNMGKARRLLGWQPRARPIR